MKTKLLTILLCVLPALIAAQNYEKEGDDLYAQSNYELAIKKYNAAQAVAGESASVSQKIAKAKKCGALLNQARLAEQRATQSNSATDYEKASQLYASLYAEHASSAYKSKSAAMKQKAESIRSQVRIEQQRQQQVEQKKLVANSNGYAYVDLGLSVKWATCNVGASNPWDYGDYFAWGETVGYGKSDPSNAHNQSYTGGSTVKTYYYWRTYKYCSCNDVDCLTKYNYSSTYGTVDNKYILDLSDDAARVNMGGSWRMPTYDEQTELLDNCYWEWTDSYSGKGVKGYIVYKVKSASDKGKKKYSGGSTTPVGSYSLSDPHIFLPAAGYRLRSGLDDAGNDGYYWSSSLDDFYPVYAYYLGFRSGSVYRSDYYRCLGYSVRAVVE